MEEASGPAATVNSVIGKKEALLVVGDYERVLELEPLIGGETCVERELHSRVYWKLVSSLKVALRSSELDVLEERRGDLNEASEIFQLES